MVDEQLVRNKLKEYFDFGMTIKKFRNDFKEGLREEFIRLY